MKQLQQHRRHKLAAYTAEDVKKLRESTAAGMLDCKKALDEADGDYAKALDLIRVKGLKGVTKREGRLTSNGAVVAKVEGNLGVMLELNCETDFVAKGERFVALADELLAHLQNAQSDSVESDCAFCKCASNSSASAIKRSPFATKSVSQLSSSITPRLPSTFATTAPFEVKRPSRFVTPLSPLTRMMSSALL